MMETGFKDLDRWLDQMAAFYGAMFLLALCFTIFVLWCLYVFVTSRRDWFEEDVRIRNAEKSYNLAKAEQVRLESIALKDRLDKSGIDTKNNGFV